MAKCRTLRQRLRGLYLTYAASLFPFASSQAVMQLIPPIQEVEIQRGRTGTFTITIVNNGDEDMPSRFSAHDLDMSIDGAPFIADGAATRGCRSWITLDTPESIIKAHETLVLTGTVSVPATAEGGYYAVIEGTFVGITIPLSAEEVDMKGSQIGLESKAVVAVMLTVPSSRARPVIVPDTLLVFPAGEEGPEVDFTPRQKQGWEVVMPIRNDGNLHTRVSGLVSFWSESGVRIESAPLEAGRGYLLPERTRNFSANGENVLADGYYMIRIALQTAEGRTMSQSFPFAVYEREVYPGAATEQLSELIRASSPGFLLKETFVQRKVTPGGMTFLPILMTNTVNDTLLLVPRKVEWSLNEVGLPVLASDPSIQPRSCSGWLEYVDERIVLPPGRSASFKVKIHAPEDMTGEYYSAVVFDPDRPRPDLPAEFMAGRTQLIAVASPQGVEYQVEIDTVTVKKERSEERNITLYRFRFKVRNTGNAHCFVAGNMSLEKEIAKGIYKPVGTAETFGSREAYLLPNSERGFEIDIPNLEAGQYRIIIAVNYQRETQPVMRYQRIRLN